MEKLARKKSQDPIQEKLREKKSLWNKEVSEFIDNLIHLKKMMNGWPSKFHMERSSIGAPLPKSPETIIGALAGDFQDIANKGNDIVSSQIAYSQSRRKKTAPSGAPQPHVASLDYDLVAEASNPLSRLLSKTKGPFWGKSPEARHRKYRLTMLKMCAKLEDRFEILESEIMSKGAESIFKSFQIFEKISSDVQGLEEELSAYISGIVPFNEKPAELPKDIKTYEASKAKEVGKLTDVLPERASEIAPPEEAKVMEAGLSFQDIFPLVEDFNKNRFNFTEFDHQLFNALRVLSVRFSVALATKKADNALFSQIKDTYYKLLNDLKGKLNVEGSSFEELKRNKKAAESLDNINKFAQSMLKKWLGKTRHFLSSDETTAKRSDIVTISERSRERLQRIMDSLEDKIDHKFLEKEISILKSDIAGMNLVFNPLLRSIKELKFDKPFIDLLEGKRVLDYDTDLSEGNKDLLKKKLEQERLRELLKMYRGMK